MNMTSSQCTATLPSDTRAIASLHAQKAKDVLTVIASQLRKGRVQSKRPLSLEVRQVLKLSRQYTSRDPDNEHAIKLLSTIVRNRNKYLWQWAILTTIQNLRSICTVPSSGNPKGVDFIPDSSELDFIAYGKNSGSALNREKSLRLRTYQLKYLLQTRSNHSIRSITSALDLLLSSLPEIGRLKRVRRGYLNVL
jgi:hypothetical protein